MISFKEKQKTLFKRKKKLKENATIPEKNVIEILKKLDMKYNKKPYSMQEL